MAIVKLTKDNIKSTIEENDIVLIDFWAPWCAPCISFGPIFEKASEKHEDVIFAKCNTEEEQELAGSFGITGIPTMIGFREQVPIFMQPGMLPAEAIDELIKKMKELDMDDVRKQVEERQMKEEQ